MPSFRLANSSTLAATSQGSFRLEVSYKAIPDVSLSLGCTEGISLDGHTCIFLVNEPLSWQEAEARCRLTTPGGHLVAITHPSMQEAVDALIINRYGIRDALLDTFASSKVMQRTSVPVQFDLSKSRAFT